MGGGKGGEVDLFGKKRNRDRGKKEKDRRRGRKEAEKKVDLDAERPGNKKTRAEEVHRKGALTGRGGLPA